MSRRMTPEERLERRPPRIPDPEDAPVRHPPNLDVRKTIADRNTIDIVTAGRLIEQIAAAHHSDNQVNTIPKLSGRISAMMRDKMTDANYANNVQSRMDRWSYEHLIAGCERCVAAGIEGVGGAVYRPEREVGGVESEGI